jgi:hypothetical protein
LAVRVLGDAFLDTAKDCIQIERLG